MTQGMTAAAVPPQVKTVFDNIFGKNKDDALSVAEVHSGLAKLGVRVPKEQMSAVFAKYDTDGSFKLDLAEFYDLYRQVKERPASILPEVTPPAAADGVVAAASMPKEAQELFSTVFDTNDDGKLSVSEVHKGLKRLGIKVT